MLAENIQLDREGEVSSGARAERVRVLHLHAGNLYGGVETVLVTLARSRGLCPQFEQHFALCFEGRVSAELAAAGAHVHRLAGVRISRPWTVWRARRRLKELLRRERYDAVICHMPWPLVVFGSTARAAGKQVVLWAHGAHSGKSWLERLARRTVPDLAISTSRFVGASLTNLYPGIRWQALYTPLPLADTPAAAEWRRDTRRELGVEDHQVVIVQVSRMESWKGHALHLEALSRLKTARDWVCWFAGGPQTAAEQDYFVELQNQARKLGVGGRVRFLGQRSDVPRLLAAADIFCQPNQSPEPFGIVYVEALWAGRPVVATALGGALEIVAPSCGILVEPGNTNGLAVALERLIESPQLRAELGKQGPARARELCDPASQMRILEDLIRSLAKGTH